MYSAVILFLYATPNYHKPCKETLAPRNWQTKYQKEIFLFTLTNLLGYPTSRNRFRCSSSPSGALVPLQHLQCAYNLLLYLYRLFLLLLLLPLPPRHSISLSILISNLPQSLLMSLFHFLIVFFAGVLLFGLCSPLPFSLNDLLNSLSTTFF